jgi:HSP20 family protein
VTAGDALNDAADLADDARRLLLELDREVPGVAALSGECRPPIDVFETSAAVEVLIDVPGVPPEAIRIAIRRNTLLIVGAKVGAAAKGSSRFHIAERSYGRFARAVRLGGAVDTSRARAVAAGGEVRVILPRMEDRRGRLFLVPVEPR